jgi:hypothetical protein
LLRFFGIDFIRPNLRLQLVAVSPAATLLNSCVLVDRLRKVSVLEALHLALRVSLWNTMQYV